MGGGMESIMNQAAMGENHRRNVRDVQNMLFFLSHGDPTVPRVNPTGYYGAETAESVASFQRSRGLPVTGRVDADTFDRICNDYEERKCTDCASHAIYPFERMLSGNCVCEGEAFDLVLILQIMLDAISTADSAIEPGGITGVFDEDTRLRVEQFQREQGFEVTGKVDRRTWDRLADVYNATRYDQ